MAKLIERELDPIMEKPVTWSYFKSNVGTTMFCPSCDEILDCQSSTEVSLYIGEKLSRCIITCDTCAERNMGQETIDRLDSAFEKQNQTGKIEVYSGRNQTMHVANLGG